MDRKSFDIIDLLIKITLETGEVLLYWNHHYMGLCTFILKQTLLQVISLIN